MKKFFFLKIVLFFLVIIITISLILNEKSTSMSTSSITVSIPESPYSSDPLDFDFLFHHIIFYSVFSPLVTEYKTGAVTGLIAESWASNDDFTKWTFKIRSGLKFSNGDPITADATLKSLKRIFFLLKNRNSQNSIVENILEIENFKDLSGDLPGLRILPHHPASIMFSFKKPIKNFLSLISFGMYSIVHPSLYEPKTGKWIDKKKSISSSAYTLEAWKDDHLILKLRSDYKTPFNLDNDNKLFSITIFFPNTATPVQSTRIFDLEYGTSDENQSLLNSEKLSREFFGGTISEIRFVRCLTWYLTSSPCFELKQRVAMRDIFYQNLIKLGYSPIKSFFPLIMSGIKDIDYNFKEINLHQNDNPKILHINSTNASNPIVREGYISSLNALAKKMKYSLNFKQISSGKIYEDIELQPTNPAVDICSNVSGIYIDKPQDDVQFMFKSKEGVMLPDTDGRIMRELEKTPVNLQRVNELLWEQAVVWPLSHYGIGFWAKKNTFDFTEINLSKTPTMFELIRLKKH